MPFIPVRPRALSQLEREWEDKLREHGEGKPELKSLFELGESDGITFVEITSRARQNKETLESFRNNDWSLIRNHEIFGEPTGIGDLPEARYWAQFAQDVHELSHLIDMVTAREFLLLFSQTANITESCRAIGIGYNSARNLIAKFNELRRVAPYRMGSGMHSSPRGGKKVAVEV